MILWLDAQLSPALAPWITQTFDGVQAFSARWLDLLDAEDLEIWQAAREADTVVMTKDQDFVRMLDQYGPPPRVLWVTCGNTSNAAMRELLVATLPTAIALLQEGEALVEISGPA